MKKGIILSVLSAITLVTIYTVASGFFLSSLHTHPGTIRRCPCENLGDILGFRVNGSGEIQATWLVNSPASEPIAWSQFQVTSFRNTQLHNELGVISYELDNDRLLTSEIRAQEAGADFPATVTNRWHVKASDGNGIEYLSVNPVIMEAVVDESTWPNNRTPYSQVGTTDFERVTSPGIVAFTLSNASATVTEAQ